MPLQCLKQLAALASIAGSLALAAPALADAPSGADFTQALPAAAELRAGPDTDADGPVIFRTGPIEAPRRFDLVGVDGASGVLEYRTARDGGPWSGWVEADAGEPVWAGGADRVQVRSHGGAISGRLHYVRIGGGDVDPKRLLARGGGGLGPARRGGKRLPREPRFITRAQWGANAARGGCEPRATPETGRVKAGVIHHTVSTNTYTRREAPGIVLAICRYHRNANGWNDIGYNALVDRFGNLYEGRAGGLARAIVGAQAEGINSQTTGIASIGDNREYKARPKQRESIVRYLAWKFGLAGIEAEGRTWLTSAGGSTQRTPAGERVRVPRIFGHIETNYTACPGAALNAQLARIRREVGRKLGSTPPPPPAGPGRR